MGESQCMAICGDRWKLREELLGEGLFLGKFGNDVGVNESLPFFVGGGTKNKFFCITKRGKKIMSKWVKQYPEMLKSFLQPTPYLGE
jgi:hypothetical protein